MARKYMTCSAFRVLLHLEPKQVLKVMARCGMLSVTGSF